MTDKVRAEGVSDITIRRQGYFATDGNRIVFTSRSLVRTIEFGHDHAGRDCWIGQLFLRIRKRHDD